MGLRREAGGARRGTPFPRPSRRRSGPRQTPQTPGPGCDSHRCLVPLRPRVCQRSERTRAGVARGWRASWWPNTTAWRPARLLRWWLRFWHSLRFATFRAGASIPGVPASPKTQTSLVGIPGRSRWLLLCASATNRPRPTSGFPARHQRVHTGTHRHTQAPYQGAQTPPSPFGLRVPTQRGARIAAGPRFALWHTPGPHPPPAPVPSPLSRLSQGKGPGSKQHLHMHRTTRIPLSQGPFLPVFTACGSPSSGASGPHCPYFAICAPLGCSCRLLFNAI